MNRLVLTLTALLACAACAQAGDPELEKVRKNVVERIPGISADAVTPSSAPGLYPKCSWARRGATPTEAAAALQ